MPAWLLPIVAAPFIGSFLGVVIRRLPAGNEFISGRSHCEHCGTTLAVRDLIPIASWIWNRAHCRHCGTRLSWFYPAIEMAALAIAVAVALVDTGEPTRLWLDCFLGWTLLTLAWIDVENFILPDAITLPLILAGLAATAWEAPDDLTDHALAAALGYVLVRAVAYLYRRLRGRDGIGEGDAKLLAAGGAWLGLIMLDWLILVAAVVALAGVGIAALAGRRLTAGTAVPFGAALALAFFAMRLR